MGKYSSLLLKLLPTGKAWNKERSSNLSKFSEGVSEEFLRVEKRGEDLLVELDPSRTSELIPDWENLLGLPDPAFGTPETIQERRRLIQLKISSRGGQSRKFFIDLIKALGFDIEITEHRPFRVGVSCVGDDLTNSSDWAHTWTVTIKQAPVYYFKVGESAVGEPLRVYKNQVVQQIIDKLKPAHTHVIFSFLEA